MDPSGPAQPGLDTVYTAADNPVDQNPQEQYEADVNAKSNTGSLVEAREHGDIPVPSQYIEDATPSSLGYGVRDAKNDAGSKVRAEYQNSTVCPIVEALFADFRRRKQHGSGTDASTWRSVWLVLMSRATHHSSLSKRQWLTICRRRSV